MTTYARVLRHLDTSEAYSIPEIAADLGLSVGVVRAAVKELVRDLRVQPLGTSASNARCYGLTQRGREAIAEADIRARTAVEGGKA